MVIGDARVSLKHASDHNYGLFVLNVFGGDTIPVNLLTRETVRLYLSTATGRQSTMPSGE